jgi:putative ABC transport system permease protein
MMALIALVFAVLITQLLLPLFAQVSGKNFMMPLGQQVLLYAGFFLLALITGLLAGSYPAFYLSSFQPIKVLKGKFSNSLAAVSLRKALVIFQFVISVVLIVASVVINKQMNYLQTKDLGFTREQQIILPLRSATAKNLYSSLKNEISRNSNIVSVGASLYYPGIFNPQDMPLYREGATMNESKRVYINWIDETFLQTLDIEPAAGRFFSKAFPADTITRLILNETAVRQLGFGTPENAIGKSAVIDWQGEQHKFAIVGVTKDFHFQDLHVPIEPYGFRLNNAPDYNYLIAHAKHGDVRSTLKSIETIWRRLNPNEPFDYSFLDQDFNSNYTAETRLASIVAYFTVIAILISCLGLFGLATFSAEQRTKEIGVRKVLGASVPSVVGLLSKDFLKLVAIAVLIASPLAWYIMNKWLQDFEYRTGIGWQVFAITTGSALFIALLTISFQAIRAALSNPVKSLRTE